MKQENKLFFVPLVGKTLVFRQKEGIKLIKNLPLLLRLTAGLPPQRRKMCSGFTLIELLVVVIIIGILAAIALPQYQKAVEKVRAQEALTLLVSVSRDFQATYLRMGAYPTNFDDLNIQIPWKEPYVRGAVNSYNRATDGRKNKEWGILVNNAGNTIGVLRQRGRYKEAGFASFLKPNGAGFEIRCIAYSVADHSYCTDLWKGTHAGKVHIAFDTYTMPQ